MSTTQETPEREEAREPAGKRPAKRDDESAALEPDARPQPAPAGDDVGEVGAAPMGTVKRRPHSVIQSFNYAFEGVVGVLRREPNMRVHFAIAAAVLGVAIGVGVTKLELIALILAVAIVLITEMINTAVEAAVDLTTNQYSPLAKLAKDVAAGAVLISAIAAIAVGYLVLVERLSEPSGRLIGEVRNAPVNVTIGALVITVIAVIAVKAISGRGTPLSGGFPSGHAALGFAGWMAITFVVEGFEHRLLVSVLALIMALLVAQTRIESGIHSTFEVAVGAAVGTLVTLMVFQVLV